MRIYLNEEKLNLLQEDLIELNRGAKVPNNFIKLNKTGENSYAVHTLANKSMYKKDLGLKDELFYNNVLKINIFDKRNNFVGLVKDDFIEVFTSAELHLHTGYSLLDGMIKIKDIANKSDYACAITDHGVLYGCIDFYNKMKEQHKKPVIGFEAYTENIDGDRYKLNKANRNVLVNNHLILLAKNRKGYQNICKINSLAQKAKAENGTSRPRVKQEWLREYNDGIICLTACLGGELPKAILSKNDEEIKRVIENFINIFGKENLYLEIQRHNIEEEEYVTRKMRELSKEYGLKLVATVDAHYLNKEDKLTHEAQLCLQTGKKMTDSDRWIFPGDGYYYHTSTEKEELFHDYADALINTLEVVDKCQFEYEFGNYELPKFPLPEGITEGDYFTELCWKGFEERFPVGTVEYASNEYRERLQFEIDTILRMGYPAYFLIVWDFIRFSKENGIGVGPGRGSACGSLASYCLKITDMNPLKYDLLFERFLNPDRISMPDIDIDFNNLRREEVINYCRNKYGADAVSKIITFGTLASKNSVLDTARIWDKSTEFARSISDKIPSAPKMTLKKALEESIELKEMYDNNPEARDIIDKAMKIEGLPRNISQHACFEENTLVTTSKGLKRIADIELGDKVLTHNKRFMPVMDLMTTETDTVYTVKASSSAPIEATPNHPFYVREMSVKRLRAYKDGVESSKKTFSSPKWKAVEELNVGTDYLGIPVNQESKIPNKKLNLPFGNKDFWWVVGRFIGDGWLENPTKHYNNCVWNEKRVIICCSNKDNQELNEITEKLISCGIDYRVEKVRTTFKIHLKGNNDLYTYFETFGKYAHGKYLNEDILDLPTDILASFLNGYMSADGSYNSKDNRYTYKTVSKKLAIGLMQVVNKVYNRPTTFRIIPAKTETIENRIVNSKEKYEITFTIDTTKKERSFYENGYIWTRLSVLEKRQENKTMYNLTVLNDSSYVVHGLCVHNCGLIIAPSAVTNYCPQVYVKNKDTGLYEGTTQFTMSECEAIGLLKMDFLGLKTMTVLQFAIDDINRIYGENLTIDDIPIDDPKVYEFIAKGQTKGVFQLEGDGMTKFMTELFQDVHSKLVSLDKNNASEEEKNSAYQHFGEELFERVIAGISLYRPGPIHEIPNYIKGMLNKDSIAYDTPELEGILNTTYGVIVYQEQAMMATRELAGFSKGQADKIRKGMA